MKKWAVPGMALLLGAALAGAPSPAAAELKVGISGYVKLEIQYGDRLTGEFPSPGPSSTPLDTDPVKDNRQTIIDARQSRLRATFSDEAMGVKLSGAIETDFYTKDASADSSPGLATANSARLRLRHAFARADHPSGFFLLAGQWWSLFQNETIAQPQLVDFNGPVGQIFARQPQLRVGYKNPLARGMGDLVFEVDVEKAFTDNDNDGAAAVVESRGEAQTVPLVAGKISWLHPRFQAEVAGAITDSKVILPSGADVSEAAWGVQVSAQVNVIDPLTIFAHFHVQEGLGRLLNGDFGNAVIVDGTTDLQSIETVGWYAGASFKITPDTSINGVFGWHEADEIPGTGGLTGTSLETQQSIHVNVIHKFWQRWQAGLEYRRFDVEAFNGTDGDVNFVHGALWFFF